MQLFGGKGKMLGLLLVLAAFGSFYLGDITAFTTSQKAIAGVALFIIVLLAGISLLKPKKTEEDMIAEQDERNQYIELKCAEKAFRVALYASFMTIIAGMIAFGLTRAIMPLSGWLWGELCLTEHQELPISFLHSDTTSHKWKQESTE